jgi:hypothetical protein
MAYQHKYLAGIVKLTFLLSWLMSNRAYLPYDYTLID